MGQNKRRRADGPDDGSVGRPVVGGVVRPVVRPVVQDVTKRRADGPDDGSVSVVKCVWYCKHIDIAFVRTSPSEFLFSFLGWTNGKRGGYAMELWPLCRPVVN